MPHKNPERRRAWQAEYDRRRDRQALAAYKHSYYLTHQDCAKEASHRSYRERREAILAEGRRRWVEDPLFRAAKVAQVRRWQRKNSKTAQEFIATRQPLLYDLPDATLLRLTPSGVRRESVVSGSDDRSPLPAHAGEPAAALAPVQDTVMSQ